MASTLLSDIPPNIGEIARVQYRDLFFKAVANGTREPLVVPYCLVGPSLITSLYLTFSHINRPWLYHARWLVLASVFIFDFYLVRHMSSMNVASAYASGLMAVWGILSTMNLLIWSRPQFDFARVVKTKKKDLGKTPELQGPDSRTNGAKINENGVHQRKLATTATVPSADKSPSSGSDHPTSDTVYSWQTFPHEGTFLDRLNWTMDLASNFRLIGWNSSIPSVPRPEIPRDIRSGDPVSFDNMPVITQSGYRRSLTQSEFLWSRLQTAAANYLLLDFLAVFMVKDPFFVYGPGNGMELNPFLQKLPAWLLFTYRQLAGLAGVYGALQAIFNLHDLFQYYVFSYQFPMRAELWQYSTIYGSFSQVLDRGLAGWWGSWWHQTFRAQFVAPARYLIKHGYIEKNTTLAQLVALFVSFLQSSMLHAAGSVSSMRTTHAWLAPTFFLLQPPGVVIQIFLTKAFDQTFPRAPRYLRRTFNLVFVVVWLQLTAHFFLADMALSGIWLLEPVPFSFFRMAGYGHPNDTWWRWWPEALPRWHSDERWWKSGLQI